ncbi:MAG: AraC family transcriptional regulator [Caulobacteraceae bacterium]|nr:AraC family transcriptional regulator [Caulobacteraceae bacterium]
MDPLSDVLRLVGLTAGVFLDAEFSAPFSLAGKVSKEFCRTHTSSVPDQIVNFHFVTQGELFIILEGGQETLVKAGQVVLLPHNSLHVLASAPNLPTKNAGEVMEDPTGPGPARLIYGGDGARTRMVCGFLGGNAQLHPLLSNLPPIITIDLAALPSGAWLASSFAFAMQTLAEDVAGSASVLAKVSELMFVEAVRRYLSTLPDEQTGWLAGLRDPSIGRALALMHARAAEDWTADAIAREINLSRSAFAERFTSLVGVPPMRYLLNWRMDLARHRLRDTNQLVAQIAYEVGYESEAAFARAFRREVELPPAAWRAEHS